MRAMLSALVTFLVLGSASTASAQNAEQRVEWNRPFEPFQVVGNVYYVGTEGLSAFLVTSSKGHVLIDGGLPESAPLIARNIEKLGFRLSDVRYLLINHSHFDHAGGLAELKRRTGAKLVSSAGDRPDLEAGKSIGRPELDGFPKVKVDRTVADGAKLRLGEIELVAHVTPGHTKGCISWSTRSGGKTVLFACSLTVAGQGLVGNRDYPTAAADFAATFAKLRKLKADVFLNFHPGFFDMEAKRARQKAGETDAFVDSSELVKQVARAEKAFATEYARQKAAAAQL